MSEPERAAWKPSQILMPDEARRAGLTVSEDVAAIHIFGGRIHVPEIRELTVSVEITREQLEEIEWSARYCEGEEPCCPVCRVLDFKKHSAECWIGKALAQLAVNKV